MAGVQIGALHISLSADSAAFDQGMNQAQNTAADAMGNIESQAKKLAGVLAGVFAIDMIQGQIQQQLDYADSLSDIAARADQTTEALSAVEYALHFSDATLQDYTGGLEKLSQNMAAAAEGGKAQAEMFDALGIKIKDQDGHLRNSADVINDLADVMAGLDDGATKTSVAMDVLGKSAGPQLLPFLNQGSAGIKELTAEAEKFNLVVSTEASEAAGQLNDNLDKMHYAATGVWRTMAVDLAPTLGKISEHMLQGAQDTRVMEGASYALSTAIKLMYTGFESSIWGLTTLGDLIGKVSAVVVTAATGNFEQAAVIWRDTTGKDKAKQDLLAIGNLWQDAGKKAAASGKEQSDAAEKAAATLALQNKLLANNTQDKKGKDKPVKDNFEYGGLALSATEYNNASTAEALSGQIYSAQEDIAAQQFGDMIDSMLIEMDAAQTIADAQWAEFIDSELVQVDAANTYKLNAQNDFISAFLAGDLERVNGVITNGNVELEARKAQMAQTVSFFHQGLASMAQGQSKAAKAAKTIQQAQALYEIGVNTYRAAMGAYAALAPIPVVGPALGVAAAAAAIAFGGSMAQGVMSGGSPSGGVTGGAPGALPTTSSPTSQADQRQAEGVSQTTYIRIPEDAILTGRKMLDFIDEALGDGKQLTNLRFVPAN